MDINDCFFAHCNYILTGIDVNVSICNASFHKTSGDKLVRGRALDVEIEQCPHVTISKL